MPSAFHCSVVTPEKPVFEGEVTQVVVPGHDGEIGFLRDRAPILLQVGQGTLRITTDGGQARRLTVAGGFAQMKDNNLTVLTDSAEEPNAPAE